MQIDMHTTGIRFYLPPPTELSTRAPGCSPTFCARGVLARKPSTLWCEPESWKVRCGALGPETQSSNFPFWTVRHPACSPKGGSILVRSSNFTLLGRHCTSSPAAPRNPASREGQPRTPASPDPPFGLDRSYFCQFLGESTFTVRPGEASTWGEKNFIVPSIASESRLCLGQSFPPLDHFLLLLGGNKFDGATRRRQYLGESDYYSKYSGQKMLYGLSWRRQYLTAACF